MNDTTSAIPPPGSRPIYGRNLAMTLRSTAAEGARIHRHFQRASTGNDHPLAGGQPRRLSAAAQGYSNAHEFVAARNGQLFLDLAAELEADVHVRARRC